MCIRAKVALSLAVLFAQCYMREIWRGNMGNLLQCIWRPWCTSGNDNLAVSNVLSSSR